MSIAQQRKAGDLIGGFHAMAKAQQMQIAFNGKVPLKGLA
jgi:hypothetical protein